jgi:hypothetical protein
MMNIDSELLAAIQTPAAVRLRSQPSIGDQQAHMAYASLGFNPRVVPASLTTAIQHDVLASTDPTSRPRLEPANSGELGEWAEADERCPYCKSGGYALHAHELGNLTRLEGFCRFCGTHTLTLLD